MLVRRWRIYAIKKEEYIKESSQAVYHSLPGEDDKIF